MKHAPMEMYFNYCVLILENRYLLGYGFIFIVCISRREYEIINLLNEDGVGCIEVIMKNQVTNEYEFDRSFQCSMCELTTIDMDRKHHNIAVGSIDSLVTIIDCYELIAISTLKCQK